MQRVNDRIRDELAELLTREARDPRLQGIISITGVETAPDLTTSRIFVSVLGDEKEGEETLANIKRATSFFRRELAARLNLRRTPELDFRLDRTIADAARIQAILREINLDQPVEQSAERPD
jgi:ribosome-binding factor A